MASRKCFKTEEGYMRYKRREYERYYGSTQLYPPRRWDDSEIDFLINNYDTKVRDLSFVMQRPAKSIEHVKARLRKSGII